MAAYGLHSFSHHVGYINVLDMSSNVCQRNDQRSYTSIVIHFYLRGVECVFTAVYCLFILSNKVLFLWKKKELNISYDVCLRNDHSLIGHILQLCRILLLSWRTPLNLSFDHCIITWAKDQGPGAWTCPALFASKIYHLAAPWLITICNILCQNVYMMKCRV